MKQRSGAHVSRRGKGLLAAMLVIAMGFPPAVVAGGSGDVPVIRDIKKKEMGTDKEGDDSEVSIGESKETPSSKPPELPTAETEQKGEESAPWSRKEILTAVGAGAAGAAALALALGGGGGSSSPPPPPPEPFNGPDISGQWVGEINLVAYGPEAVSATIIQHGKQVQIRTTTTLPYGRYFVGTIDEDGAMLVYDQETGEDWSTFQGNATSQSVRLYDWVIEVGKLDKLKLHR